jgi:methyl coenzyme M reductase subunit D
MQNEVFVPLPHSVEKGEQILESQFKDNQELFTELKQFCEQSFSSTYELDRTVYARGIRVITDSHEDVARLHEWLDN